MKNAIVIIILFTLLGCKKDKSDQELLKDSLKGTWNIESINTVYYDSDGDVLLSSNIEPTGKLVVSDNKIKLSLPDREVNSTYTTAVSGEDRVIFINDQNDYLAFQSNNGIFIKEQTKNSMTWESTLYNVTYVEPNTNGQVLASKVVILHTFKK